MRKEKSNKSLSRMLSTWNKRYFILDLERMVIYYLPDKGASLSNATKIPLAVILFP